MPSYQKGMLHCPPSAMSDGPLLETVPVVQGGTPRDVSDPVKARNTEKAFVYKDKWGVLRECIRGYNSR